MGAQFFHNVKALWRKKNVSGNQHVSREEHEILRSLENTKSNVSAALADDFDTPKVLASLLDLIHLTNCCMDKNEFSSIMILNIAKHITSVLPYLDYLVIMMNLVFR